MRELVGAVEPACSGAGVDVRDVGGDPSGEGHDVVEAEFVHEGASLEEEAEGLADAARGAEDRDGETGRLVRRSRRAVDRAEVRRERRHASIRGAIHFCAFSPRFGGEVRVSRGECDGG